MMLVAFDNTNVPLSFVYIRGVAVTGNGVLPIIDLSNATLVTNASFVYTDGVGVLGNLGVQVGVVSPNGRILVDSTSAPLNSGAVTLSLPYFPTIQAPAITETTFSTTSVGSQQVIDWGPAGNYALDIMNAALPGLTAPPAFDPGTGTLTLTTAGGALQPDVVFSMLQVSRTGARNWNLTMASPASAASIVFPHLPTDVFDWNPAATDTLMPSVTIAKVPGGYNAIRLHAHALTLPPGFDSLITGASGRVVVETSH